MPSKATLFCPECGHRSRTDGDWRLVQTRTATRYRCPDCGTDLTSRPSEAALDAAAHPLDFVGDTVVFWGDSARTWQSLCLELSPPYREE